MKAAVCPDLYGVESWYANCS